MKIGIVGNGVVGRALATLLSSSKQNCLFIYDKFQPENSAEEQKSAINACDLVFVAVPTPTAPDGISCDTSAVYEAVSWITPPICIKSTIPPGTVDDLTAKSGKPIAFSPEYVGESLFHPWKKMDAYEFVIVGGPAEIRSLVLKAYQNCMGPEVHFYPTEKARTAELCKYMENCFLATKVSFVNQFYDIAQAIGVNFDEVRELWLVDPRIGRSHSYVTEERGFRGRCLPKDVRALVAAMRRHGGAPLLEAVLTYNEEVCRRADQRHGKKADAEPATMSGAQVFTGTPPQT